MEITIIICITFIICFIISSKIFYNLKINKEFTVKASNIVTIIQNFRNEYIEDYYKNDAKDSKYKGKGLDLCLLLRNIENILRNK